MTKPLREKVEEVLMEVCLEGFKLSGEGYNAEYPFGNKGVDIKQVVDNKDFAQDTNKIISLFLEELSSVVDGSGLADFKDKLQKE